MVSQLSRSARVSAFPATTGVAPPPRLPSPSSPARPYSPSIATGLGAGPSVGAASDLNPRRHRWQPLSFAAQRRLGILCFGILLPYSIFIQAVGSYSAAPLLWNRDREGDYAHAVWDFRDNPIARGLWW